MKTSLMKKHLTDEICNELKGLKTKSGYTIEMAVNSGIKNPDSSIGIYAGDEESYELFGAIFNPIIKEYHGFSKDDKHKTSLHVESLKDATFDDENIISTRIRVGRNLAEFPLGTNISNAQRKEVEKRVVEALKSLTCKGKYYSLESMDEETRNLLIKEHFLFKEGDRFLEAAGLNRDWPSGRGIYHNEEKTFLVWVNEEDQLRIISMQKGGDIKEVFARLVQFLKELEETLNFAYSEHLGFITSCPTNLGTAMRASVHVKLPKLSKDMQKFEGICSKYHLQIRGIHGEHSKSEEGIFDISNKRRLGVSEIECVQDMVDGVRTLLHVEKNLYM
jgi:creatine kinase/arginine kinase